MTQKELRCNGCGKRPADLEEYVLAAYDASNNDRPDNCPECGAKPLKQHKQNCGYVVTADRYVLLEEGTLNPENHHFLCTPCYIKAGMPSSHQGWVAP